LNALEQLAERSDRGFPHLTRARALTERRLAEVHERLAGAQSDSDACVALFGSWGRRELTELSDYDWAILVNGTEREGVRPALKQVEDTIGVEEGKPGTQEVFGTTVWSTHRPRC